MKRLYLLRHGQTLFNKKDIVQGQCDSRLTELGEKQGAAAGKYFRDHRIEFDRVYTSDLPRTEETLAQFYDGDYRRLKGLRERSYGIYEGDSNMSVLNLFDNCRDQFDRLGLETDESLTKRMTDTLSEIMDEEGVNTVLAVSHGDSMRTFAESVDAQKMKDFGFMPNCAIFVYDYDEKNRSFKLSNIITEHVADLYSSIQQ